MFSSSKFFSLLLAFFAVLNSFTYAQLTYKILSFNTIVNIDNVPITVNAPARKLRMLAATSVTGTTNVTLDTADTTALTKGFGNALANSMGMANSVFDGAIAVTSVSRQNTGAETSATLTVAIQTTVDFSNGNFSEGVNTETTYIQSMQTKITTFVTDGNFTIYLQTAATETSSAAFASATVQVTPAPTYSGTTETTDSYTYTVGDFDHGDPKRDSPKVGAVSVGVVIGVIMLGLSFYVICFFRPPTTAKVEDGVVNK